MSFLKQKLTMPVVKYSVLGLASCLWVFGLVDQLYSSASMMKYLLLSLLMAAVAFIYVAQQVDQPRLSSLKKSLPLSSTTMKAGKSTTSIRQIASMPSSAYSTVSTFLMQCSARFAATPPIEPR